MNITPSGTAAGLLAIVVGGLLAASPSPQSGDTFVANATIGQHRANPEVVQVTVVVDRYTTEAENASLRTAVKQGTTALRALFNTMPDLGSITVSGHRTALKYAYKPPKNGGQTIVMLTAEPIAALTTAANPPKAGFDLALVSLDFSTPGFAVGEVDPAVKVTTNSDGLIVTESHGAAFVRLSDVEKK